MEVLPPQWMPRCATPSGDRNRFAQFVKTHPNLTLADFDLKSRIGSNSRDGLVYEAVHTITNIHVAVKFIPRVYRDPWQQEVDIATHLGHLAENDTTLPFPIVAASGNTTIPFPQNSDAKDSIGKEAVRRSAVANGKSHGEAKRDMIAATPADYPKHVHAMYLISELAKADAKQIDDPQNYKDSVLRALNGLHAAGYIHNDAHLGNFLVIGNDKILVHDFGHSAKITHLDNTQRDFDKVDEAINKHTNAEPFSKHS